MTKLVFKKAMDMLKEGEKNKAAGRGGEDHSRGRERKEQEGQQTRLK